MTVSLENATVAIVGAGIMGSGIAQVAAQAGHPALLYDVLPGAALAEKEKLTQTFESLLEKGKFSRESEDFIPRLITKPAAKKPNDFVRQLA